MFSVHHAVCSDKCDYQCFSGLCRHSGLEVIHDNTFKDCSKLEELTFPASLQKIGQNAFANSAGIRKISAKIDDVPTAYENSFHANAYATATVTVPSNSLPFYEEDEAWGKFVNLKGSGIAERRTFSGEIIGNGCLYINGKKFYSFSTTRYFDYASRLEIVFSPDPNYKIKSIILDGEDITDELDQDNKYVIAHILENIQMEVTFVSKDNITSSESIQNEQGEIYASASGKLAFKGFAIGTPVYVYDITGKLVTMFEIQGDDVWDISYKGIVIVRIGKDRAIKLRL